MQVKTQYIMQLNRILGGFNRQQFIEKFNIDDRYMPTLLLALGKAGVPAHKTTRLPIEEIVEFV